MLSAVILEDEILAQERLKLLLKENNVTVLEIFTDAKAALNWFENHSADVTFVDIELPEISGVEFVEQLKKISSNFGSIIFCTAFDRYAVDAFQLRITDYLMKPVRASRLKEALMRVPGYSQNTESGFHFFKIHSKGKQIKLPWQKVAYLQAEDKSVFLYINEQEYYELHQTLNYWENKLRDKVIRIHRNTLVFKSFIEFLVEQKTENGLKWHAKIRNFTTPLPISRRQLKHVHAQFYEEELL